MRSKEFLERAPLYLTLILSSLNYSYGFQSLSSTTILKYRRNLSFTSPSSQLASSSVEDDGESVPKPKLTKQEEILQNALNIQPESTEEKSKRQEQAQKIQEEQTKTKTSNILIAILSFAAAILNYFYQYTHPVTDVQLLFAMSQSSTPLTEIGTNGKPTVVDFWAPWCENCKRSASTLAAIEKEYGDSVNFVMVNGDEAKNWELIERFRVDAIPHLALVSKEGYVETALIGPIPRSVLRADIDVLLESEINTENLENDAERSSMLKDKIPYKMFDAFQGNENMRKVSF